MNLCDYHFSLSPPDFGQLIDGLSARQEAWENTAKWFRGDNADPYLNIEECSDEREALEIADHYQSIITTLRRQASWQHGRRKVNLEAPAEENGRSGWCLFVHAAAGEVRPAARNGAGFEVYPNEHDAREAWVEDQISRCLEYLSGSRDWDSVGSDLFVAPVTLNADGSITDTSGGHHRICI